MKTKNREIKWIFGALLLLFAFFLTFPVLRLLAKSFQGEGGLTLAHYGRMLGSKGFGKALANSILVSAASGAVTTVLAFFLAYTIHYTNVPRGLKRFLKTAAVLPMLLPTLTYGFAIIYSFGKQGLITRLVGRQLFDIYGFNGLLLGYVIYTLPISFLLIHNTMAYIDKRFGIVSRIMGDSGLSTFWITIIRPLLGTLAASFIQSFFLCFTDFGIPASVGGRFEVIAAVLYDEMLGSVPDFAGGAVVAMVMLLPSAVSIALLHFLEKYNVRYSRLSPMEPEENRVRDVVCGVGSTGILVCVLSVFLVIFLVPFVSEWPYELNFTLEHVRSVFTDQSLVQVVSNSLRVALCTAAVGTLAAYGGALIVARSTVGHRCREIVEGIALVTNTIPGMVIGLAFLFSFSGTPMQNTFFLIILCNVVHFFSTPYLMMKSSLAKMNASWETTAMLMGDSWIKTILRVVTPNAFSTIVEVFGYYFVNAMVTVSAVIFLAGARTMVMTTKIKELQYLNKYNEVFVLSMLILFINLAAKGVFALLAGAGKNRAKGIRLFSRQKQAEGRAQLLRPRRLMAEASYGRGILWRRHPMAEAGSVCEGEEKTAVYR